jgi:hypothetical protein
MSAFLSLSKLGEHRNLLRTIFQTSPPNTARGHLMNSSNPTGGSVAVSITPPSSLKLIRHEAPQTPDAINIDGFLQFYNGGECVIFVSPGLDVDPPSPPKVREKAQFEYKVWY